MWTIYIILELAFFWVKCHAGLCIFKYENLFFVVVKHGYFILAIYKLYLMAENLKSWTRGKLVQKWKIKPKGYTDKP